MIEHNEGKSNISQSYVFIQGDNGQTIMMWEILLAEEVVQEAQNPINEGARWNGASLVIEHPQFFDLYKGFVKEDRNEEFDFVNLAANKEYLILNHNNFEKFDVFTFCGFNQYFNLGSGYCQKILQKGTGLFSLELPFELKD